VSLLVIGDVVLRVEYRRELRVRGFWDRFKWSRIFVNCKLFRALVTTEWLLRYAVLALVTCEVSVVSIIILIRVLKVLARHGSRLTLLL